MLRTSLHTGGFLLALLTPLVVNPWAALPFEPIKVTFVRWVILLMLVVLSGATLLQPRLFSAVHRGSGRCQQGLLGAAVVYGLVLTLAALRSPDPLRSWWGASDQHGVITTGCGLLAFILLSTVIRTPRQVAWHLLVLVAGSVPVCLYGLVQFAGYDPLPWQTDSVSPVLATLGRSNIVGASLAVMIPLTLHWVWLGWRQSRWRTVAGVGVILLLQWLCLLTTQARAGWLAFLGGVALWWWLGPRPRAHKVLGLLLFGLLSGAIFVGFERLGARTTDQPAQLQGGADFAERRAAAVDRRWIIWRHTLPLIRERWLLGYGPEMFAELFNRRYPPGTLYAGNDTLVDDPHNLLLEHLVVAGVIGTVAWGGLVILFYANLFSARKASRSVEDQQLAGALCAAMTAYVLQAQLNPDTIVLTLNFWLLLAYNNGLTNFNPIGRNSSC